jgi:tRNA1Val (adenine37-N6)-methyltransferase
MKPFHFKQFTIHQDQCAMKVTLDACLFGALCAQSIHNPQVIQSALDIGAGTGLLSLMLAQKKITNIKSIELDSSAANQANYNVANSPFKDQIQVIESDINLYQSNTLFDLIISNPPFFSDHLKGPNKERNQARHNDGLSFDNLNQVIKKSLSEKGTAWILLPCNEFQVFKTSMIKNSLHCTQIYSINSTTNKPPHRVIFSIQHKIPDSTTIAIESSIQIRNNDASDYSNEFKQLLKDYYLKL